MPDAIAPSVFMEQGATTMPSWRKGPAGGRGEKVIHIMLIEPGIPVKGYPLIASEIIERPAVVVGLMAEHRKPGGGNHQIDLDGPGSMAFRRRMP